mgnify:CR=1 FL=1
MTKTTPSSILEQLISKAKNAGADTADALFMENRSLSVAQRLGKPESIERSEDQDLGLRVFVGKINVFKRASPKTPRIIQNGKIYKNKLYSQKLLQYCFDNKKNITLFL